MMRMLSHGFLGYSSSFMLDFVVCALVLIVPLLVFSLYQVRIGKYTRHRNLQILLAVILLAAVTAFEVDLQVVHGGWENIVGDRLNETDLATARQVLHIHLLFAVTTPLLWATTLILALRRFPNPPTPAVHSRLHRTLGWASTIDIVLTSVTGLTFYYVAIMR